MKKRISITGKVHDVGYRAFLLGVAESLNIRRFFAENLVFNGKQVVEVLIDGKNDLIETFVKILHAKKPENAEVERIEVEDYDGEVMSVVSYYRYLTAMQLSKIATYGGKMLEKQDLTLEKQDKMLEKQDMMLDKQDKMLEKQDTMLGKMDLMLEKQEETIGVIKDESAKTREKLGEKIDSVAEKIDHLRVDMKTLWSRDLERLKMKLRK